MLTLVILSIVANVALSHLVAQTAEKKEIGYNKTFWISFFFSPLIGILLSIASPVVNNYTSTQRWYKTEMLPLVFLLLTMILFIIALMLK